MDKRNELISGGYQQPLGPSPHMHTYKMNSSGPGVGQPGPGPGGLGVIGPMGGGMGYAGGGGAAGQPGGYPAQGNYPPPRPHMQFPQGYPPPTNSQPPPNNQYQPVRPNNMVQYGPPYPVRFLLFTQTYFPSIYFREYCTTLKDRNHTKTETLENKFPRSQSQFLIFSVFLTTLIV